MQPSAATLDDVAAAHDVSTDAASALAIGEAHVTWLGTDIIDGGQLIVQPASAFAASLETLRTQGLADTAETKLLEQLVSAKLSIAVIGNHGPVRRSVLKRSGQPCRYQRDSERRRTCWAYTGSGAGSKD